MSLDQGLLPVELGLFVRRLEQPVHDKYLYSLIMTLDAHAGQN